MTPSFPWRGVDKDSDGIVTIHVNDEDISNFPVFMRFVLQEKHGQEAGVFKVVLDDSVDCPSKLPSLIDYAKKYYSTKVCDDDGKTELPRVDVQDFFYGSYNQDIYGFRTKDLSSQKAESVRDTFLAEVTKPNAYMQKSVSEQLLERSLDSLVDNYWTTIRWMSAKSCGMDLQEDKVDINKLLDLAKAQRQLYGVEECPTGSNLSLHISYKAGQLQKEGDKISILYAAGVPIDKAEFMITTTCSMNSLGTIMDVIPTKVPGVSSPFLYFGMELSSFAWHIEDIAAFSINYLHYGAPCIWFIVPPPFFKSFKDWAQHFFLDPSEMGCNNILGASHKYIMASASFLRKLGIPVHTVVQRERELIILYPYAAHSGFKTGLNVQQAVNFMDPWCVELSIFAPTCDCSDWCVQMDLKEIVAVVRPDILQMYVERDFVGLMEALKENKYLKDLGLLPFQLMSKENQPRCRFTGNSVADKSLKTATKCVSQSSTDEEGESPLACKGSKCDLRCPGCEKKFKGGRSKLNRVRNHIKMSHGNDPSLLDQLHQLYPAKSRKSKVMQCEICGEWKAGSKAQMQMHIRRKHAMCS